MENKFTKSFFAFLFTFCVMLFTASAQKIYKVDIKEDIGPNAWRTVNLAHKKQQNYRLKCF